MEIRAARRTDLARIAAILEACRTHLISQGIHQWDDQYPTRVDFEDDLASGTLFVGLRDRSVISTIVLNEHQEDEYREISWEYSGGRPLIVHRLLVHPHQHRRGVASQMIDFAERYAAKNGYTEIRLEAFAGYPASLALYDARKYRRAGIVQYRMGCFQCFEQRVSPPVPFHL